MPTGTTRGRFWGPAYPDVWDAGIGFWGPAYPDPAPDLVNVDPVGPDGVATFVLDLEGELTVSYEWVTDVFKSYDGREKRSQILDRPRRTFVGGAYLLGMDSPAMRARLTRFASAGSVFLLAMPFEGVTLQQDSTSTSVFVPDTAVLDWANAGQRVVSRALDGSYVQAVIQSVPSATEIVLDVAPGAAGKRNATLMPLVAVLFDAQQGFIRHPNPSGVERWNITAKAMLFGFQKSPVRAELDIEQTYPIAGNFVGVIAQARVAGAAGNSIRIEIDDESLSGVDFSEDGNDITIHHEPGTSTIEEIVQMINANATLIRLVGSYNGGFVTGGDDEIPMTNLAGGSDGSYQSDGLGATITTHTGVDTISRPVWDRFIRIESTGGDSMQAMNDIVDLGGLPASFGQARVPDWGRHVGIKSLIGSEFQWFKKFMATVGGRRRAFYLPTWRADLTFVSKSTNTITIEGPSDEDGGFFTWYPYLRSSIQIVQLDGTITRAAITAAVDNNDGTITLTIGTTISSSEVLLVSWLELCRFENDTFDVVFAGHEFTMETIARAVQQ
jgi:hypothetical protein